VRKTHIHPNWHEGLDNDIAVLVLVQEVEFSDRIQPICQIDSTFNLTYFTNGIIVGYGSDKNLDHGYKIIPRLVNAPIHNRNICLKKNPYLNRVLNELTFCAGEDTGVGVCENDAGSGLYVIYGNKFYLRGIVPENFQDTKCISNQYSVFVDVLNFKVWINNININTLSR
jgi:hypothetical protein